MGAAASSCSAGEGLLQAISAGEDEARIRKAITQNPRLATWCSKSSGNTLFHTAAVCGRRDVLSLLHETLVRYLGSKNKQKADQIQQMALNAQNFRGESALLLACKRGHTECVKLLVDLAASPFVTDSDNRTCLHHAATYGWAPCIKVLADTKVQTSAGPIPLPACCAPLSDGQLRFVDTQSTSGFTALHMAASHGHYHAVKALVSAKATLSIRCQGTLHAENLHAMMWPQGTTPLHIAASLGHLQMARLMLQSDLVAAVSHESQRDLRALRDVQNKAPVDVARSMGGDQTLLQLLDPEVPLEVVLGRLLAASAPSLAAVAAAAKRKQLRRGLRKMHHDSHHKKQAAKKEKQAESGHGHRKKAEAAASTAASRAATPSNHPGNESSDDEAQENIALPAALANNSLANNALPSTAALAAGSANPRISLRLGKEVKVAAVVDGSSSKSKPSSQGRKSKSGKPGSKLSRRSGTHTDEDADDLCKICYDRNVEFEVDGCGHAICYKCAKLICRKGVRDNPSCPFCRRGIEEFARCQPA